ncbi:MAG: sulfotransferase [Gracilimonas sp.]|nr:sulfotransferase [Gracilimonas sp.]
MEIADKNWIATSPKLLPDFIIGGAMKCGTTTLHDILNAHPDVFIPPREIHFFDMDNILQHPDFNNHKSDEWICQFLHQEPQKFWEWYTSHYSGRTESVLGEDSTTYLASPTAARRIAAQEKDIKLIFLLRNPTERAFSQYIHDLRKGRMTHSFEDTLRFHPHTVLARSMYSSQLIKYYRQIPMHRIHIIVFEEFIKNQENTIREVCDFLEIDFSKIPTERFETHSNLAKMPWSTTLQYLKNRLVRNMGNKNYGSYLPNSPNTFKFKDIPSALVHYVHTGINPPLFSTKPTMKEPTKEFLNNYFKTHLHNLDAITGKDILQHWFD